MMKILVDTNVIINYLTVNTKDFEHSRVRAVTPDELLKIIEK